MNERIDEQALKQKAYENFSNLAREVIDADALTYHADIYITDEGKFAQRARQTKSESERMASELGKIQEGFNQLRYVLTSHFDLDADTWNSQPIGIALKKISETLITAKNRAEQNEPYDYFELHELFESIKNLAKLVVSDDFKNQNNNNKFKQLNEGAVEMDAVFRNHALRRTINSAALMVHVLNDALAADPDNIVLLDLKSTLSKIDFRVHAKYVKDQMEAKN